MSSPLARVCLLLSDPRLREGLAQQLRAKELQVATFSEIHVFQAEVGIESIGCLVLSAHLGEEGDGIRFLQMLNQGTIRVPTIVISPHHDIKAAVQAMKADAIECFEEGTPVSILVKGVATALL